MQKHFRQGLTILTCSLLASISFAKERTPTTSRASKMGYWPQGVFVRAGVGAPSGHVLSAKDIDPDGPMGGTFSKGPSTMIDFGFRAFDAWELCWSFEQSGDDKRQWQDSEYTRRWQTGSLKIERNYDRSAGLIGGYSQWRSGLFYGQTVFSTEGESGKVFEGKGRSLGLDVGYDYLVSRIFGFTAGGYAGMGRFKETTQNNAGLGLAAAEPAAEMGLVRGAVYVGAFGNLDFSIAD